MTTPTTIDELRAELERVKRDAAVAKSDAFDGYLTEMEQRYEAELVKVRAELERVNRANAEMREALRSALEYLRCDYHADDAPVLGCKCEICNSACRGRNALSTSAGTNYVSREAVLPLVTLIDKLYKMAISETEEVCELNTIWFRRRCAEGLTHARSIGVLKEDA